MRWPVGNIGVPSGWGWAGVLAGLSLLPELPARFVVGVGEWLSNKLGVALAGVVVSQSVIGSQTVGLTVAWLLVGYLTYRYTPYLYPAAPSDLQYPPGFRLLTAGLALYMGLVVFGVAVPEWAVASPVAVLRPVPAESMVARVREMIVVAIVGWAGGNVAFGLYLWDHWRRQGHLEDGAFPPLLTHVLHLEELEARGFTPNPTPQSMIIYSMGHTVVAPFLVGMGGFFLNLLYPIPEALLLVGIVAARLLPDEVTTAGTVVRHDIELRLLDSISGATRTFKGSVMVLFSVFGMGLSGITFWWLLGELGPVWGLVVGIHSAASLNELLAGGAIGTFVIAIPIMGVYSLIHWIRQLERIGPFAHRWQVDRGHATFADPRAPPTRPPGLLIPAHLPFVVGPVGAAVAAATSGQVGAIVVIVLQTVAIGVMLWGLVRTWGRDPQPLAHESRDLLVTVLLQVGVFEGVLLVDWETLEPAMDVNPYLLVGTPVALTVFYHMPELFGWQDRRDGIHRLLVDPPLLISMLFFVWAVPVVLGEPAPFIQGVLVIVILSFIGVRLYNTYSTVRDDAG